MLSPSQVEWDPKAKPVDPTPLFPPDDPPPANGTPLRPKNNGILNQNGVLSHPHTIGGNAWSHSRSRELEPFEAERALELPEGEEGELVKVLAQKVREFIDYKTSMITHVDPLEGLFFY